MHFGELYYALSLTHTQLCVVRLSMVTGFLKAHKGGGNQTQMRIITHNMRIQLTLCPHMMFDHTLTS